MKIGTFFTFIFTTIFVITPSFSFAFEKPLKTKRVTPEDISGTFTLILYGANHYDDLETIALLDLEGDQYYLEPYAPDFDYKVKKGIPDKEALKIAKEFVSFHNSFWKSQLSKIVDNEGKTVGFEVRPLYLPIVYGFGDILDVFYWLKENGRIKVVIRLDKTIERIRFHGDDFSIGGSK